MQTNIEKHIGLLGHQVKDRVTGLKGVVTSISFDLYGCIQAIVHPGLDERNKTLEQCWFDVSRLEVIGDRVMPIPNYEAGLIAEGLKGSAEKPAANKY